MYIETQKKIHEYKEIMDKFLGNSFDLLVNNLRNS